MNALRIWAAERRSRIAIALLLLVWIYFLIAFGEQAFRANQLSAQVDDQRADIAAIQDDNEALETELDRLRSDDGYRLFAEGVARRDLGLARSNDTVVLVRWEGELPPEAAPALEEPEDSRPNWQAWLDLLTGHD